MAIPRRPTTVLRTLVVSLEDSRCSVTSIMLSFIGLFRRFSSLRYQAAPFGGAANSFRLGRHCFATGQRWHVNSPPLKRPISFEHTARVVVRGGGGETPGTRRRRRADRARRRACRRLPCHAAEGDRGAAHVSALCGGGGGVRARRPVLRGSRAASAARATDTAACEQEAQCGGGGDHDIDIDIDAAQAHRVRTARAAAGVARDVGSCRRVAP